MAQYFRVDKVYRLKICGAETKGGRSICCGIPKDKLGRCPKHIDAGICEDASDPKTMLARTNHKYKGNATLVPLDGAWFLQINKCSSPDCSQMVTEIAKDTFCIQHSKLWQERDNARQKDATIPKRAIGDDDNGDDDDDAAMILDLLSDASSQGDEYEVSRPRSTKTRKISEKTGEGPISQPPRKKSPPTTPVPASNQLNFVLPTTGLVPSIRLPISPPAPVPTKTIVPPASRKIPAFLENDLPIKAVAAAPAPTKTTPAAAPTAVVPISALFSDSANGAISPCPPLTVEMLHRHLHTIIHGIDTIIEHHKRSRARDEIVSSQLAAISDDIRELKKNKDDAGLPPQAVELMLAMLQKK